MQAVAEAKQVVVAQAKVDCEELLVQIVQDKRIADEQERQVGARCCWRWCCILVIGWQAPGCPEAPELDAYAVGQLFSALDYRLTAAVALLLARSMRRPPRSPRRRLRQTPSRRRCRPSWTRRCPRCR